MGSRKDGSGPYTVSNEEGYAEVKAMRRRAPPEPRPRDISKDVDANSGLENGISGKIRKG
jgi:hypothetical protein